MEILFNYETAKHTLVLTAYMLLIMFDFWWVGYLIISAIKWCYKKIKDLIQKHKNVEEIKEDTTNE